jgi:hypothetical protein
MRKYAPASAAALEAAYFARRKITTARLNTNPVQARAEHQRRIRAALSYS